MLPLPNIMYLHVLTHLHTHKCTHARMHTRTHTHTQSCSYGCEAVTFQYQMGPGVVGCLPRGAQQECGSVEDVSALSRRSYTSTLA